MTEAWHRDSNYVVVLSVPDEESLLQYFNRIPEATARALVIEPDMDDASTAFAALGADAGRILSNLPLAGKDFAMT